MLFDLAPPHVEPVLTEVIEASNDRVILLKTGNRSSDAIYDVTKDRFPKDR